MTLAFQNYPYASLASTLCDQVLSTYPNHFKLSWIESNDLLMVLFGTIPVPFKNSWYNIPVEFVLPKLFPLNSPAVRVVPTDQMQIHSNNNVNADGRVTMPYLKAWSRESTLKELCAQMVTIFQKQPPVYAATPKSPLQNQQPLVVTQYDPLQSMKDDLYYKLMPLYLQLKLKLETDLAHNQAQTTRLAQNREKIKEKTIKINEIINKQQSQTESIQQRNLELDLLLKGHYDQVDDCFIPEDPLLFENLVKKESIQDTLDILQFKFENKEVTAEQWMRNVNTLARELFFAFSALK